MYVQSDTLLLTHVFQNFRNLCLKIYKFDPAHFIAPGLAWQAALKKTNVKLDLLTDMDILLMVEKAIRGGKCYSIYRYTNAKNKYMKDFDKNKKSPYFKYCNVNNLYSWAMLQKLQAHNFEGIVNTSQFNDYFIKSYNEESDEGYFFLKLMFNILKTYMNFILIFHFYQRELILKNLKSL